MQYINCLLYMSSLSWFLSGAPKRTRLKALIKMSRVFLSVCFWFVLVRSIRSEYSNDWDGPLDFRCHSPTMQISRIFSVHSNYREDRRFGFECRELPINGSGAPECRDTGYMNEYDQPVAFTCQENGYINGMASVHSNDHEDRRWRYRCCVRPGIRLYNCEMSDWTNEYDRRQDFNVPNNKVLHGAFSVHNNHHEDRRFKYSLCDIGKY